MDVEYSAMVFPYVAESNILNIHLRSDVGYGYIWTMHFKSPPTIYRLNSAQGLFQCLIRGVSVYPQLYSSKPLHRIDGPALTVFGKNYQEVIYKEWYKNHLTHCVNGPALISGKYKEYHLLDVRFRTKEKWFQMLTLEEQRQALWNFDE